MFRYGSSSKQTTFRSNVPLTDEQIRHYAPSILASEAHKDTSDRYSLIPTIEVLNGLRKEGWSPFEVRQTRVKDVGRREFTKHLVRLRRADAIDVQGEVPELILVNSHDGSSSYQLLSGFFRMVCSNGLIAGDIADTVRVRHSGDVVGNVIEGSYRVLDNIAVAQESLSEFKAIKLNTDEKLLLANAAIDLKWERDPVTKQAAVQPASLLSIRRSADRADDLYSVFNVLQENVIRGGIRSRNKNGTRNRTREVQGVDQNVKLNRALWNLAQGMADIKQGRIDPASLLAA